ncbi:unnamed protein product, partial [Prorocentrum cordatum]
SDAPAPPARKPRGRGDAWAVMPSDGGSDAGSDFVEGRLLDGFLVLAQAGSSSPDDVVTVNLSSLGVVDVAGDDLSFFKNLDRIDASDNQLSFERVLEEFGRVPRLGSLSLACNTISQLSLQQGTLRQLHTLDLSFNELHGDVLAQLAGLPGLTFLNLCSNCVSSVPPEEDLTGEDCSGFRCLEELILDDNDLAPSPPGLLVLLFLPAPAPYPQLAPASPA